MRLRIFCRAEKDCGLLLFLLWCIIANASHPQGYALIEYATLQEARAAIDDAHKTKLLDQAVSVDFAFVRPPPGKGGGDKRHPGGRTLNRGRGRSRSRSRTPGGDRNGGAKDAEDKDID